MITDLICEASLMHEIYTVLCTLLYNACKWIARGQDDLNTLGLLATSCYVIYSIYASYLTFWHCLLSDTWNLIWINCNTEEELPARTRLNL